MAILGEDLSTGQTRNVLQGVLAFSLAAKI